MTLQTFFQDIVLIFRQNIVQFGTVEYIALILPKIGTMATLTSVGTVGEIDSQSYMVWYLLKNNIVVGVFQHFSEFFA